MRLLILAAFLLTAGPAHAQHAHDGQAPRTGLFLGLRVDAAQPPPGSAVGRAFAFVGDSAYVSVVYGSPFRRGRVIFGGLVGFGSLWPVGAHYATELAVTHPVRVGGQTLDPGVYTLFATPEPSMWTIHINRALGMHQADAYDPDEDVLALRVPVELLPESVEQLTIDFEPAENGADLRITWDQVRVRVPLRPLIRNR
jgi:hypothetical protein